MRVPRHAVVCALTLSAILSSLVLSSGAGGHYDRPNYTWDSSCEERKDPINAVFYGTAAVNHRVFEHTKRHTGWDRGGGALSKDQYVKDHGECSRQYDQLKSGSFSRFHVRFFGNSHKDLKGRWETSADPHHEDFTWCGHAVDKGTKEEPTENGSGFDWGRRKLDSELYGTHHPIYYEYGRNTRSFKQCDGDYAGSNGVIAWIRVGRRYP